MKNKTEVISTGSVLGAEIKGFDLSKRLTPDEVKLIQNIWDEHLVLLFRNQKLGPQEVLDFASNFGQLDPPGPNPYGKIIWPEYPNINVISNVVNEKGEPIGNLGNGEAIWHQDMTYMENPPMGIVLYGHEIPIGQGDTYFGSLISAYDKMNELWKNDFENKSIVHDAAHNSAGMIRKGYEETTDVTKTPGAKHELIRTDSKTGRKSLFVGRRPYAYVVGTDVVNSERFLNELWQYVTRPEFTWRHKWQQGDVLLWNNLLTIHRRDAFEGRRILYRAQIRG